MLLLQPAGIIPLIGNAGAAVEFQNPARNLVKEIPVVGNGHNRPREIVKEPLQPGHRFRIQMVCRLVKQQHIGGTQQQLAQRNAALFTARQFGHIGITCRHPQRVHRNLGLALEVPAVNGVNLFLQFGLLGNHRIHFIIAQLFGKARTDSVETVHQFLGLAHARQHIACHIH